MPRDRKSARAQQIHPKWGGQPWTPVAGQSLAPIHILRAQDRGGLGLAPTCHLVLSPTPASSPRRCAFPIRPSRPRDQLHGRVGCEQTGDVAWPVRGKRRDTLRKTASCTSSQSDRRTASTVRPSESPASTSPYCPTIGSKRIK